MRFARFLTILCVVAMAIFSCEKAPVPVGSVSIEPADVALPYPGFQPITLHWQADSELVPAPADGPLVFLHLLGAEGEVERTFDHPLPFTWQPGADESYELTLYQSALAPPLEEGVYRVTIGLYGADGQRWALADSGPAAAEMEYQVGEIDTAGEAAQVPMFYFSPSWLPLEAGTDVQILGRRRLTDEGSIRVAEIPAVGRVFMTLRLSEARPEIEELTLMEGATEPGFTLASSCGGSERSVTGYGAHSLIVPVSGNEAGELPQECEIVISPNFQIVEVNTLTRRSVGLEVLSWAAQ